MKSMIMTRIVHNSAMTIITNHYCIDSTLHVIVKPMIVRCIDYDYDYDSTRVTVLTMIMTMTVQG